MAWEISLTLAFIGGAFVIAYIGKCISDDELRLTEITKLSWLPVGLKSFFYFIAFGMVLMAVGVQQPIMVQNEVFVNTTDMNSTDVALLLGNSVTGGVTMTTKLFYSSIVILIILCCLLIIYKIFLWKKRGDYEKGGDYERY